MVITAMSRLGLRRHGREEKSMHALQPSIAARRLQSYKSMVLMAGKRVLERYSRCK
jgi:hypothetical protein